MGSYFKIAKSREIICQNEALGIKFSEKVFSRSLKVKNNEKGQKGQISNLIESGQIVRPNWPLGVRFSKKFVSRSFKVSRGQESQTKGQIKKYITIIQIICQKTLHCFC